MGGEVGGEGSVALERHSEYVPFDRGEVQAVANSATISCRSCPPPSNPNRREHSAAGRVRVSLLLKGARSGSSPFFLALGRKGNWGSTTRRQVLGKEGAGAVHDVLIGLLAGAEPKICCQFTSALVYSALLSVLIGLVAARHQESQCSNDRSVLHGVFRSS